MSIQLENAITTQLELPKATHAFLERRCEDLGITAPEHISRIIDEFVSSKVEEGMQQLLRAQP